MLTLVHIFFDLKNLLNPFVFFYIYQTIFCFIALSYCDLLYPNIEISSDLKLFIVVSYVLTFVGAFISRSIFSRMGIKYVRINQISLNNAPSNTFQIAGLIVFILGVLTFIIFTFKTDGIILFAEDLENERITRKSGAGLSNLIFVAFLLYGYSIVLLNTKKSLIIKTLLFLITAFALISYGSRAPLLKLIVASYIIFLIKSSKKITLTKLFKIGILLFIILATVEAFRSNLSGSDVSFFKLSLLRLSWRPFVNIQNLQRIYDFFPNQHDFLYGYSYLVDMKLFLPGSNPNFGTYLKNLMDWEFEGGSITTTFIGLSYLNFGKIAFFFTPLFYGFLFNSIYQIFFPKKRAYSLSVLFILFFSIGVSGSVSTGLFGTLINNILFLLLTIIVHLFIRQLLQKKQLTFKIE
ncbi:O-antigen polymerase [uncultured Croceitalea sp.]|uniref:O-antigen polymerase n=1 Tax=uncultured Croceitalea sp. TaxID=1798908 RepID=UPI0033065567